MKRASTTGFSGQNAPYSSAEKASPKQAHFYIFYLISKLRFLALYHSSVPIFLDNEP
jgi:hypothetical protein